MLVDDLIHGYHKSAEETIAMAEASGGDLQDARMNARYEYKIARSLNNAVRYFLDIRQIERFRAAKFEHLDFPPVVHKQVFIEFNGLLEFDFRPWQRSDLVMGKNEEEVRANMPKLRPRPFTDGPITCYKGVFIEVHDPPHEVDYMGWPKNERLIRVWWHEKPRFVLVNEAANKYVEGKTFPVLDNFTLTMAESAWPRRFDALKVLDRDEEQHPGERDHGERLFRTSVNLLYFLAAENIVRVRIRPGDHAKHGRDLAGLPRSNREYHVLPFQLPRYRYLHKSNASDTGRHVSVCFDVRGHFRALKNDCYERNADGTVRVIWVNPHQRGAGHPYQPTVRRGSIDSLFLDYDKFIRDESARMKVAS